MMNLTTREELTLAIASAVLAIFISGWLCHWLWSRMASAAAPRSDRANELVAELLIVEEQRDRAHAEKRELEAALRGEAANTENLLQSLLREREAELKAAMDGLRQARQEISELSTR
jgi:hypothetical protein